MLETRTCPFFQSHPSQELMGGVAPSQSISDNLSYPAKRCSSHMIQIFNKLSREAQKKHMGDYLALKPIIEQSLADIERVGAWPMNAGEVSIFIVDGADVFTKSDPDFNTDTDDGRQLYKEANLRIEIGVELLGSTLFTFMRKDGTPFEQTMTHVLGHEIFHLEQGWRLRSCNFHFSLIASNFAHAVRQEMSTDWKDSIKQLATDYRNWVKSDEDQKPFTFDQFVARASDTVSECCADLLGLKIFHAIHSPIEAQKLADNLVAYRMANEAQSPLAYQSGQTLDDFLKRHPGQDHPLELIVRETWEMAFDSLKQSPVLPDAAKNAIAAAPPLTFTDPLPDVFRGIALRSSI
jgi:hypothetical protein